MAKRKFSLFREELKRAWRELRGPATSPLRAALAVSLGLFIGSQPIFGCHTPLVVVLCVLLQLDGAIAWVASNISNPFFAPALLTFEVEVGAYLRTGAFIRLDQEVTRSGAWSKFARDMFLGAPLVGLGLAVTGGAITYASVAVVRALFPHRKPPEPYRLPDDAPPWVKAVERLATRYAPPQASTPKERTRFHYVRTKLIGDPIAKLLADVAGDAPGALGAVSDIGAGRGQLPLLMMELGRATSVWGVDWDASKVEAAQQAAREKDELVALDATFERGDVRTAAIRPADTVMLIDVLHYVSIAEQDALLDRAASAVLPGGRVLVRDADTERGWRSWMTLAEERFFTFIRFNRGERVTFRAAREIVERLEAAGLQCEVRPAWGKTPFSNVLVIGRRPS